MKHARSAVSKDVIDDSMPTRLRRLPPLRLFEVALTLVTALRSGWLLLEASEWLSQDAFHVGNLMPPLPVSLVPILALGLGVALVRVWQQSGERWAQAGIMLWLLYALLLDPLGMGRHDVLCMIGWLLLLTSPPSDLEDSSTAPLLLLKTALALYSFAIALVWVRDDHWLTDWNSLWATVQGPDHTEIAAWMLRNLPLWLWSGIQGFLIFALLGSPALLFYRKHSRIGPFILAGGVIGLALIFNAHVMSLLAVIPFMLAILKSSKNEETHGSQLSRLLARNLSS